MCTYVGIVAKSSESLFTYNLNDSWSTYYSPDFTPVFKATFTNSTLKALAMERCKDNKFCLFDAATTGRLVVGISTLEEQSMIEERQVTSTPSKPVFWFCFSNNLICLLG